MAKDYVDRARRLSELMREHEFDECQAYYILELEDRIEALEYKLNSLESRYDSHVFQDD